MRAGSARRRGRIVPPILASPARAGALAVLLALAVAILGCGQAGDEPSTSLQAAAALGTTTTLSDPAGSSESPPSSQPPVTAELAATVPGRIAGMPLSEYLDGEQAITQVEQLHGKGLGAGLDQAWLATYGAGGAATLWVSRSVRLEDATALMDRMKTKIAGGGSPFTDPQTLTVQGVEVEALNGMGQRHFYFRVGKDLYWLAIEPGLADAGLRELVSTGLQAAKVD